ncbi:MAG: hypothetical protein RLZZ628_4250, partial [Bacteroidota bacterium]
MTKTIDFLDNDKMSNTQLITILLCFLMNTLDGMDVMVVSYAAPAIAKEWAFTMQTLGVVFSAGLVGMTVGTLTIAPRADVVGRRAVILLCAVIMGLTVFATYLSQSIEQLVFFRFISGIGIGGMLASSATLTSEYAPKKTKDFWVSFVMSGYPVGAVLSGLAAAQIIPAYGWRAMFQVAGVVTLLTLPFIYLFLSESLDFLLKKRPANALQKINAILSKMSQPTLSELPMQAAEKTAIAPESNPTIGQRMQIFIQMIQDALLTPERKLPTLWLWTALFMSFGSMYYLLTWIPKLAASTGLSIELAIYAGAVFNLGAFIGIVTQGYLSSTFGLRRTILWFFIATAILMAIFGFFKGSAIVLVLFGLIGFGIQGGFVGLYAVAARLYPTEIRSTGVGFGMSMGRIGGIVGPFLGGSLATMGLTISSCFLVFAVPVIIAGIATMMI